MKYAEKAEKLARTAHRKQFRRDGVTPYIVHPERVAKRLRGASDFVLAAAWLHDVVEDTDLTIEEISQQGFPVEITAAVDLLTKRTGQSRDDYLNAVRGNEIARKVKIADIIDNLSDDPTPAQMLKCARGLVWLLE